MINDFHAERATTWFRDACSAVKHARDHNRVIAPQIAWAPAAGPYRRDASVIGEPFMSATAL